MKPHVKNAIFIDIDSEREQPIMFGKPPSTDPPTTPDEAAKLILLDIGCVAEALTTLIVMAHNNKYGDKTELVNASIKTLYGALETPDNDPIETTQTNEH